VPYDFTATFTVQEELGCRGARVATFAVSPVSIARNRGVDS